MIQYLIDGYEYDKDNFTIIITLENYKHEMWF